MEKHKATIITIAMTVLAVLLANSIWNEIQNKKMSKKESAEFAEEVKSMGVENAVLEVVDIVEEAEDKSVVDIVEEAEDKSKDAALAYLDMIIKDAFMRGTDNTLNQIILFAQKTNEDGTIEPICDTITVGEIVLINTVCLKQADNE